MKKRKVFLAFSYIGVMATVVEYQKIGSKKQKGRPSLFTAIITICVVDVVVVVVLVVVVVVVAVVVVVVVVVTVVLLFLFLRSLIKTIAYCIKLFYFLESTLLSKRLF